MNVGLLDASLEGAGPLSPLVFTPPDIVFGVDVLDTPLVATPPSLGVCDNGIRRLWVMESFKLSRAFLLCDKELPPFLILLNRVAPLRADDNGSIDNGNNIRRFLRLARFGLLVSS